MRATRMLVSGLAMMMVLCLPALSDGKTLDLDADEEPAQVNAAPAADFTIPVKVNGKEVSRVAVPQWGQGYDCHTQDAWHHQPDNTGRLTAPPRHG